MSRCKSGVSGILIRRSQDERGIQGLAKKGSEHDEELALPVLPCSPDTGILQELDRSRCSRTVAGSVNRRSCLTCYVSRSRLPILPGLHFMNSKVEEEVSADNDIARARCFRSPWATLHYLP